MLLLQCSPASSPRFVTAASDQAAKPLAAATEELAYGGGYLSDKLGHKICIIGAAVGPVGCSYLKVEQRGVPGLRVKACTAQWLSGGVRSVWMHPDIQDCIACRLCRRQP